MLQTLRRPQIEWLTAIHLLCGAVGTLWWALNLWQQPAYGDTSEYWSVARTLDIDGWRTMAYPLVLRGALWIPGTVAARTGVYLLQTACALGAVWHLIGLLEQASGRERSDRLLLAWLVCSSPLVAHFTVTVLPDSLAAAALVVGASGTLRVLIIRDIRAATVGFAAAGLAIACALRPERPFFVAVLLVCAASVMAFRRRWKPAIISLALVAISVLPVIVVNRWSQTSDVGRSQPVASERLFERVVAHRFGKLHPHLPAEIRKVVSLDEARAADADFWKFAPLAKRIQDEAGDSALWRGALVGLRRYPAAVVTGVFGDLFENAVAPLNWVKESVTPGGDWSTEWTNSRMAQPYGKLTRLFITGWILIFLVDLVIAGPSLNRLRRPSTLLGVLAALGIGATVFGALLALSNALDAHIRYGLPIVIVWQTMAVWAAIGPITMLRRARPRTPIPVAGS